MIHIENRQLRIKGNTMELLKEATTCLKRAVAGFCAVSQRIENDEAKARDMTEKVMEAAFRAVRKGAFAFEEVNNTEIIEDGPCSVPEL